MIQVTRVKINQINFTVREDGAISIEGTYSLISDKGDVVSRGPFNGYQSIKFEFDQAFGKNVVSDAEGIAELQLGIQSAVKISQEEK